MSLNDINGSSHTRWNCKYHIVFAPKCRRKVFYEEKRLTVGKILRQWCEWERVKIIEAEVCQDHAHISGGDPNKDVGVELHGIPERKKQHHAV